MDFVRRRTPQEAGIDQRIAAFLALWIVIGAFGGSLSLVMLVWIAETVT